MTQQAQPTHVAVAPKKWLRGSPLALLIRWSARCLRVTPEGPRTGALGATGFGERTVPRQPERLSWSETGQTHDQNSPGSDGSDDRCGPVFPRRTATPG